MTITLSNPSIKPQRLQKLLRRLIEIYSPSGKEEEILDYLRGYLRRRGLPVTCQSLDDHRYNLIVMPSETEVHLVLVGHIDTVVAYDLDHLGYEKQGDWVTGLGAADMKGGCASMLEAYLALHESGHVQAPVALALVVGEEEEGDGARKLVSQFHFPWAIVGEPTDLQPCLSHYGYLEVQITTTGRRVHASLADMSQSPIDSMLRLLLEVSHYIEGQRPEIVYNIRDLSSPQAGFAVPDRCDAWLDIHLPPSVPLEAIKNEIEAMVEQRRRENSGFNGSVRFPTMHAGYELEEEGDVVEALKAAYARQSLAWSPQAFRSHSDANLLWEAGVKPILLGPGQLEKAHAPDEAVSFSQVHRISELYLDLILAFSR